jgi:hypothetical protein
VVTDPDVITRLDRIERLLDQLAQQRDALTPAQRAAMRLLIRLYGADEIITSAGVIDAARYDDEGRTSPQITCYGDTQKFGILLGQVARSGAIVDGMRLVSLPKEAKAGRWVLEVVESL